MSDVFTYRSVSGKWLCGLVWAGSALATFDLLRSPGLPGSLKYLAIPIAASFVIWLLFWRPKVVVDDQGVRFDNVLRTVVVPWRAIQRIDTKWALTLFTAGGKFTAWAAPAPSGAAVRRAASRDVKHLPESTYASGGVRPGDLPESQSGQVAIVVRERWEKMRDAGLFESDDAASARWTWRWGLVAGLAAVAIAVALAVVS